MDFLNLLFNSPKININFSINKILSYEIKNDGEVAIVRVKGDNFAVDEKGKVLFKQSYKGVTSYYLHKKSWEMYGESSFLGLAFFDYEESQNIKKQLIEIAEKHFGKFSQE